MREWVVEWPLNPNNGMPSLKLLNRSPQKVSRQIWQMTIARGEARICAGKVDLHRWEGETGVSCGAAIQELS